MLTQRLHNNPDGTSFLVVTADAAGKAELIGLAENLDLRSTVQTEGTIHFLNDPAGNAPQKAPE